ncbi:MAG: hypothetical protein VX899_24655 [Myxococcota bacterium]|nr:hypothetical protein [Myxococcota bacterium]
MRTPLVPLLALAALTGCSYAYEITYEVTVAPTLVAQGGSLNLELQGQERNRKVLPLPPDGKVTASLGSCCSPEPRVQLLAWIDQNGDNERQADEPVAWDSRGEFKLTEDTTTRLRLEAPAQAAPPEPKVDTPATGE